MGCRYLFLAALTMAMACEPTPRPKLICHNSNCVEPADPAQDDTLDSMDASLKLRDDDGRPLIDGIEMDLFWHRAEDRCIFAHDLDRGGDEASAVEGAQAIANFLETRRSHNQAVTQSGTAFAVFVELKGHVGASKDEKHNKEEKGKHAQCAIDVMQIMARVADQKTVAIELVVTSFEPTLLSAVREQGDYKSLSDSDWVTVKVGALQGVPPPLDGQTAPIDAFDRELTLDMVSVHPHWVRDAAIHSYRSNNWELSFWMFSGVSETFSAIDKHHPEYVVTSEARLLHRWLNR